jgi:hypothetical protein
MCEVKFLVVQFRTVISSPAVHGLNRSGESSANVEYCLEPPNTVES